MGYMCHSDRISGNNIDFMPHVAHVAILNFAIVSKAAFIVYCICVAVSCSGRISVSAPTTALRYCKEVNLTAVRCVELQQISNRYIGNAAALQ